ncbi:Gfo/Idh/MocA family protein [Paenibacillus glycinis]|uniref:Gfo/Idh/MocA family oxidoreductase n=1 Tax=Paenibacillus glycinis TaxID=2697035 RepID=A0ABW9XSX1_9BACL|nr:Gfo/Idh/MocA family oxidoreductase [Paenibacillus glycinis]NBD25439.1 Gfo/Idh/MocA family oxidoreductase [Paenibacillus glycinis]
MATGNTEDNRHRRLRIGVLGCGPISQAAHFDACRRANNAELYAICDVAEDLTARMAAIHEPRAVYSDYDAMLADPNVDAVIVGIADAFHVGAATSALEAGKHVLVEKPLGTTIEQCEALAETVARTGLVLQVGNMKRFDPGIVAARDFIREEMGEMLALKAWYCDSVYRYAVTDNIQPIPVRSAASRKPEEDPTGDKQRYFMLTHGSHLVDTARFLGGDIVSVQASYVRKFEAHCWFAAAEFASGAIGHLDLTIPVRMDWHEGFQVYGEHGSVTGTTYHPWRFKSSDVELFSTREGASRKPLGADAHFFKLQVEGFADAILNGAPQRGADVQDGLAAMRAMAAIAESAQGGRKVRLADVAGSV